MKTLIGFLVVVAVAAAVFSVAASGQSDASRFTLLEHDANFKFVDVAPKGGPQGPPSVGDEFVIGGTLTRSGKQAGTTNLVCTVTKPGKSGVSQCNGTITLGGDTISASGLSRFASNVDIFAVVGGTGRYAGASGTVISRDTGKGDTLTFDLR